MAGRVGANSLSPSEMALPLASPLYGVTGGHSHVVLLGPALYFLMYYSPRWCGTLWKTGWALMASAPSLAHPSLDACCITGTAMAHGHGHGPLPLHLAGTWPARLSVGVLTSGMPARDVRHRPSQSTHTHTALANERGPSSPPRSTARPRPASSSWTSPAPRFPRTWWLPASAAGRWRGGANGATRATPLGLLTE